MSAETIEGHDAKRRRVRQLTNQKQEICTKPHKAVSAKSTGKVTQLHRKRTGSCIVIEQFLVD